MATVEEKPVAAPSVDNDGAAAVARVREAQQRWASTDVVSRLKIIRKIRHTIVREAVQLAEKIELAQRTDVAESLAVEIWPTADACRFLERNARRLLATRRGRWTDRPIWGVGLKMGVQRDPLGVVMIIGTWNYPLFLTGSQLLQALVAGNGVMIKPGEGTTTLMNHFVDLLVRCGIPEDLVRVLPEDPGMAMQAIDEGVGKVVFTGSAQTGRKVLEQLARTGTPSIMELSGSDAVFITQGADLDRVADCVEFGLRINGSSTCIAPRRMFVPVEQMEKMADKIRERISTLKPAPVHPKAGAVASELVERAIADGAQRLCPRDWTGWQAGQPFPAVVLKLDHADHELLRSDVFAPVVSMIGVTSVKEALRLDALCPYALGATVFGERRLAEQIARQVDAGCVVVNDIIAPTGDSRVPFGGRRASGFGVTRGAEGLLEMTQLKAIVTQTSSWLPHLDRPVPGLDDMLLGLLGFRHGGTFGERIAGLRRLMAFGQRTWKQRSSKTEQQ